MKDAIHPTWYPDAVVTCACGNAWRTASTKKEIHTDVCNKCHPFFTGEQRIVDTAGQVERFNKRMTAKEQIAATQATVEDKRVKKDRRRGRKVESAPQPEAPADLPLAVAGDAPQAQDKPAE
ncbi:MAG: 50S ribosomal protein L31 [Chloroflexi bacterium]|nr:50S ribosomal protein L31 [Chloroflexota bacterium]